MPSQKYHPKFNIIPEKVHRWHLWPKLAFQEIFHLRGVYGWGCACFHFGTEHPVNSKEALFVFFCWLLLAWALQKTENTTATFACVKTKAVLLEEHLGMTF